MNQTNSQQLNIGWLSVCAEMMYAGFDYVHGNKKVMDVFP